MEGKDLMFNLIGKNRLGNRRINQNVFKVRPKEEVDIHKMFSSKIKAVKQRLKQSNKDQTTRDTKQAVFSKSNTLITSAIYDYWCPEGWKKYDN